MKNNNGKVAIAIVAMFVVALSIVGLTYAYFTATVTGNDANESIKVTAGELVITYNNSNSIAAVNIVPGWISDGKTFYDPVYSIQDFNGVRGVTAVSTDEFGEGDDMLAAAPSINTAAETNLGTEEEPKMYSAYGLAEPATFNIVNKGTDAAAYEVKINATSDIADKENVHVYLYEATSTAALEALDITDEEVKASAVYKTTLDKINGSVTAITDRTLATTNETKYYMLVVEYKEIVGEQDDSQGTSLFVEIEVNGLPQNRTTTVTATQD